MKSQIMIGPTRTIYCGVCFKQHERDLSMIAIYALQPTRWKPASWRAAVVRGLIPDGDMFLYAWIFRRHFIFLVEFMIRRVVGCELSCWKCNGVSDGELLGSCMIRRFMVLSFLVEKLMKFLRWKIDGWVEEYLYTYSSLKCGREIRSRLLVCIKRGFRGRNLRWCTGDWDFK